MSHYTKVKVKFSDPAILLEALKRFYPEKALSMHSTPRYLKMFNGYDAPQKAQVIVARNAVGDLCNDIGFEFTADGCVAHICDFAKKPKQCYASGIKKMGGHGEVFMNKLSDEYAAQAIIAKAKAQRRAYEREDTADGKIKIFVRG